MKNTFIFSVFTSLMLLSFLTSCNTKSQKNSLAKKWTFDTTAYKQHFREIYDKNTKPDQISISETTISQSTDMLISMKLFLNEDGNADFTLQGNNTKGKWDFVEDKKLLVLQENGKIEKKSFEVKEISSDKMTLIVDENMLLFFKQIK
jgi:hypothetical protein